MASALSTPLPPGPKGQWPLGNLPEFGRDILGFLTRCQRDHGDLVFLRLGRWPAYLLSDPSDIETVLLTRYRDFTKHRFFWRHVEALFGQGLVASEGEYWRRQRQLMAPAFHRERITAYGETMVRCTEALLGGTDSGEPRTTRWRDGAVLNLHAEMMRLTGTIAAKTLFSTELDAEGEEVIRAFDAVTAEIAARFRRPFKIPDWVPTPGNRRYRAGIARLDRLVYRIIEAHRHGEPSHDVLGLLMNARTETGEALADRALRDEVVTLFLAGHETTALALTWAFYLLARHPEAEARLHAEVDAALAGRAPSPADLPGLPYTDGIVKEALRLYPPAYVLGRENVVEVELGGQAVPAGTTLLVSPWVMHRDPRFFENPDEFRPERWADGLEDRLPRFAYLPFGGGPRFCIGQQFALMEARLLLAGIARKFRLVRAGNAPVEPFPSITLRPAGAVEMKVVARGIS
jgi:cytochrome P450